MAVARADLQSSDAATRIAALQIIGDSGNDEFLSALQQMVRDPNPQVSAAARSSLNAIVSHQKLISFVGDLLHGLSLASVLLFAALGLAITFGLLGVINMAHGEMLMLGAYATYAVQTAMHGSRFYLFAAIPVAFLATALVGVVLERTVIRHLYGRPLETLLATWGISLGLIQTVRLIFGAQNVAVANPDWLAGGVEIAHGLVLPWSRIAVVGFVIVVSALVWLLLQRTRFGLQVRAVTQNRPMAACLGIPTRRIDAWCSAWARGSPAWAAWRCRSWATSVPSWARATSSTRSWWSCWAGVGRLAGAVAAALGLGVVNKLLEPLAGAVTGKIVVLGFIILFIQRRPQGLFALKGSVEA